jgi:hypothetical protein
MSSGQGPLAGSCEHGNEGSGSIKGDEFLYQLIDYQIFNKGSMYFSRLLSVTLVEETLEIKHILFLYPYVEVRSLYDSEALTNL